MFQLFRKYKVAFTAGMIGFYLVGGMQFPVLECLHYLSHLGNMAGGNYQQHNLHDHNNQHSHLALSIIDGLTSDGAEENLPVEAPNNKEFKKVFQWLPISEALTVVADFQNINTYYLIAGISGVDKRVPTPPPQV